MFQLSLSWVLVVAIFVWWLQHKYTSLCWEFVAFMIFPFLQVDMASNAGSSTTSQHDDADVQVREWVVVK